MSDTRTPADSVERRLAAYFQGQRHSLRAPGDLWSRVSHQLAAQDTSPIWRRFRFGSFGPLRLALAGATAALMALVGVLAWQLLLTGNTGSVEGERGGDSLVQLTKLWGALDTGSGQTAQDKAGSTGTAGPASPVGAAGPAGAPGAPASTGSAGRAFSAATATAAPAPAGTMAPRVAATVIAAGGTPVPAPANLQSTFSSGGARGPVIVTSDSGPVVIYDKPQGTPAPGAQISREEAQKIVEANAQGGYGMSQEQYERLMQQAMSGQLGYPPDHELDNTTFENYGVNPFVSAAEQPFSTFAMDVDTASYTIARAYINSGRLPPVDAIRVEEFVNYFDQGYAPATEPFVINIDGARSPFAGDGRHLLRVGVNAQDISLDDRRDAVITFVIDTSGSMGREDRLELAKRGLRLLIEQLRPGDRIGIVEYGSTARVLLEPTADKAAVKAVVGALVATGSTNAEAGLRLGYQMATKAFEEGKINRVILVSDGVANTGQTDPNVLLDQIKESSRAGVTLSAIGVGLANYNDVLLEKLADHGDGNYAYIDTDEEAARLFGDGLTGLLEVVASDAKIQVEFDAEAVEMYRLIGYENRALATEQFRDDTVDAGEVGSGHTVTALYELRLREQASGDVGNDVGTVRVRYADVATGKVSEIERKVAVKEIDRDFVETSGRLRFTASVAAFAEILRRSPWATGLPMSLVAVNAEMALKDIDPRAEDMEFVRLVRQAVVLADSAAPFPGDDELCPEGWLWRTVEPNGQPSCVAPTPAPGK